MDFIFGFIKISYFIDSLFLKRLYHIREKFDFVPEGWYKFCWNLMKIKFVCFYLQDKDNEKWVKGGSNE